MNVNCFTESIHGKMSLAKVRRLRRQSTFNVRQSRIVVNSTNSTFEQSIESETDLGSEASFVSCVDGHLVVTGGGILDWVGTHYRQFAVDHNTFLVMFVGVGLVPVRENGSLLGCVLEVDSGGSLRIFVIGDLDIILLGHCLNSSFQYNWWC